MSTPPTPPPGDAGPAGGAPPPDPHTPQPAAPVPMPAPVGVPQMAAAPVKKGGKGKVIGIVLGAMILVGGLGFAGWKWGWPFLQQYLNGGGLDTPHGTVEYVLNGLGEGKTEVLWEVLPETNRVAITDQIKKLGANSDPEVHAKGVAVLKNLNGVLKSKKTLFIEMANGSPNGGAIPKEAIENYDGIVELLEIVANSKFADPAWLQNPDMEAFFKDDLNQILNSPTLETLINKDIQKNFSNSIKDYKPASFSELKEDLRNTKATTVDQGETTATVESSFKRGDEIFKHEPIEMKKVGDRWLPTEVADGLDKMMQDLAQSVPGGQLTESKMTPQQKQAALGLLNAIDGVLTQVEGAQSVQQLQGQFLGAMFALGGPMAAAQQAFASGGRPGGGGVRPPGGGIGFPPTGGLPGKGGKGKNNKGGGNSQLTQAQRMNWTFGGQQRNLQAWKGQSAGNVIGLFGQPNPANARAIPGGGEWTYTNLKITDAQGASHSAITFVVQNGVVADVRLAAGGGGAPGPGGGIDPVTGLPLPAPQN